MRSLLASVALTALLAACAPGPYGPNRTVGTLAGAGAGAFVGNQFGNGSGKVAATAGGAVIGGVIGNSLGYNADRAYYGGGYAYAPLPPRYSYYPPASYYGY